MSDVLSNLRSNYISEVQLEFLTNVTSYPVARCGPGYMVFACDVEFPQATTGILKMSIDERVQTWNILLKDGAVPFDRHVEFKYIQ